MRVPYFAALMALLLLGTIVVPASGKECFKEDVCTDKPIRNPTYRDVTVSLGGGGTLIVQQIGFDQWVTNIPSNRGLTTYKARLIISENGDCQPIDATSKAKSPVSIKTGQTASDMPCGKVYRSVSYTYEITYDLHDPKKPGELTQTHAAKPTEDALNQTDKCGQKRIIKDSYCAGGL